MIIDSDTLYFQWRNITSLCPERCDFRWLDLNLCPISDPSLRAAIAAEQSEPTHCEYGYAYFAMQMGELIGESRKVSIPKLNAGHLALKYQTFAPEVVTEYNFVVVPKLSRISPLYMAPDVGFTTLNSTGRFKPLLKTKSSIRERAGSLRRSSEEANSYFKSVETRNDELVDVIDNPKHTRKGSAEQEWIGLNLIANYRYTKATVQLLYLPTRGTLYSDGAADDVTLLTKPRHRVAKPVTARVKSLSLQDVKGSQGSRQRYSGLLLLTSNDMLAGTCDELLAGLQTPISKGLTPEQYTDAVTTRATSDEDIQALREDKTQEAEALMSEAPASKFIFSKGFASVMREASPHSPSREGDSNPNYLFDYGDDLDPVWPIRITVFDTVEEEFVSRTLDEWQAECMLDDIALMPIHRIPNLMRKGFSADDILYLSTKINDATPDAQADKLEEEFIKEETEITLR